MTEERTAPANRRGRGLSATACRPAAGTRTHGRRCVQRHGRENINEPRGECSPNERPNEPSSREVEGGAGGSPKRTEPTLRTLGASDLTSPDRAKGKWEGVESATEHTPSAQTVAGGGGGHKKSVRRRSSKRSRDGARNTSKTRIKIWIVRDKIFHERTKKIAHRADRETNGWRRKSGLQARSRETRPVPGRGTTGTDPRAKSGHARS